MGILCCPYKYLGRIDHCRLEEALEGLYQEYCIRCEWFEVPHLLWLSNQLVLLLPGGIAANTIPEKNRKKLTQEIRKYK